MNISPRSQCPIKTNPVMQKSFGFIFLLPLLWSRLWLARRLADRNVPPSMQSCCCCTAAMKAACQQYHSAVGSCSGLPQPSMRAAVHWKSCYSRKDLIQNRHSLWSGPAILVAMSVFSSYIWLVINLQHQVSQVILVDFWAEAIYMHVYPSIH